MKVIGYLETVHAASQEGGQLNRAPFSLNVVGVHDFLLTAMVLYIAVKEGTEQPVGNGQADMVLPESNAFWRHFNWILR